MPLSNYVGTYQEHSCLPPHFQSMLKQTTHQTTASETENNEILWIHTASVCLGFKKDLLEVTRG